MIHNISSDFRQARLLFHIGSGLSFFVLSVQTLLGRRCSESPV